jgi:hypothetical protein
MAHNINDARRLFISNYIIKPDVTKVFIKLPLSEIAYSQTGDLNNFIKVHIDFWEELFSGLSKFRDDKNIWQYLCNIVQEELRFLKDYDNSFVSLITYCRKLLDIHKNIRKDIKIGISDIVRYSIVSVINDISSPIRDSLIDVNTIVMFLEEVQNNPNINAPFLWFDKTYLMGLKNCTLKDIIPYIAKYNKSELEQIEITDEKDIQKMFNVRLIILNKPISPIQYNYIMDSRQYIDALMAYHKKQSGIEMLNLALSPLSKYAKCVCKSNLSRFFTYKRNVVNKLEPFLGNYDYTRRNIMILYRSYNDKGEPIYDILCHKGTYLFEHLPEHIALYLKYPNEFNVKYESQYHNAVQYWNAINEPAKRSKAITDNIKLFTVPNSITMRDKFHNLTREINNIILYFNDPKSTNKYLVNPMDLTDTATQMMVNVFTSEWSKIIKPKILSFCQKNGVNQYLVTDFMLDMVSQIKYIADGFAKRMGVEYNTLKEQSAFNMLNIKASIYVDKFIEVYTIWLNRIVSSSNNIKNINELL